MFNVKSILTLPVLLLVIVSVYFLYQPPVYKRQLVFKNSAKSVQDSMKVLQEICKSVDSTRFINCFVQSWDSILVFKGDSLGKINAVSASNPAFNNMKKEDAIRLLSIMKFLNKNLVAGVVHQTTIGCWLFSYGDNLDYDNIKFIRNIYIWNEPQDTLSPAFKYNFTIIDRKENTVLISLNDFGKPVQNKW